MRGFTLIEILVVISIMALLAVGSFVYFKDFSARQYTNKAAGEIQSLFRLAQSNATSSTICKKGDGTNDQSKWSLKFFNDHQTIKLLCGQDNTEKRTYILENARFESSRNLPVQVNYAPGSGVLTFSCEPDCNSAQSLTFTLNPGANQKTLTISKGGAVNVQ